jgi:rfaE bifunctional protein nucleotidyltransferase chain/domain
MRRREKIVGRAELARIARRMESRGERLVLTNGCFDLLHAGHVRLLQRARRMGEALAVAVNSDASVRRLKGRGRPITPQRERLEILASLQPVDYVVLFAEPTPGALIRTVRPHVLVKGGDWRRSRIVGRDTVRAAGGRVRVVPLEKKVSTTKIIRRILERFER